LEEERWEFEVDWERREEGTVQEEGTIFDEEGVSFDEDGTACGEAGKRRQAGLAKNKVRPMRKEGATARNVEKPGRHDPRWGQIG
jgi:hypothetical protein